MDRINRFLEKRPAKNRKVVRFRDKKYEITKEDVKKVRKYRASQSLDGEFKLARPLDLRFSAILGEPLPAHPKRDRTAEVARAFLRKASRTKASHLPVSKNVIRDVWEEDTLDSIKQYDQEWKYSIKQAYEGRVSELNFNYDDLKSELRRVFLYYFRPRDIKEKRIDELLPRLPEPKNLKPFPEEISSTWIVPGTKFIYKHLFAAISGNSVAFFDSSCGKLLLEFALDQPIKKVCFNDTSNIGLIDLEGLALLTSNKIYIIENGLPVEKFKSESQIKDIALCGNKLGVITSHTLNIYDVDNSQQLSSLRIKHERPHKLKFINHQIYLATANGIMNGTNGNETKILSYVIDFTSDGTSILAINNLDRLIVMDDAFKIKKSIVEHSMGKEIKAHKKLNLFAILFSGEIGIYKSVNKEYIPVHSLKGKFKTIEWHEEMPWLYAGNTSKVVLYT